MQSQADHSTGSQAPKRYVYPKDEPFPQVLIPVLYFPEVCCPKDDDLSRTLSPVLELNQRRCRLPKPKLVLPPDCSAPVTVSSQGSQMTA